MNISDVLLLIFTINSASSNTISKLNFKPVFIGKTLCLKWKQKTIWVFFLYKHIKFWSIFKGKNLIANLLFLKSSVLFTCISIYSSYFWTSIDCIQHRNLNYNPLEHTCIISTIVLHTVMKIQKWIILLDSEFSFLFQC